MSEQSNKQKYLAVLGLAMGLPSVIIGTSCVVYQLIEAEKISNGVGLIIIVLVVAQFLFMMVRYVLNKKNK